MSIQSTQAAWNRCGGMVMVIMTLIGWSSVPLFIKHFAAHIDVWTSNGWRYGFSALLWLPVLIWGLRRHSLPGGIWKRALVPSVFNSIGQVAFAWAHYKIDPGLLTFALRTQIVFVAIGAAILFIPERRIIRSRGFIIGILLVLGGTMTTVALDDGFGQQTTTFGIILALISGACFAGYALSVRHYMHGTHPLIAFSVISQYTAAAMLGLMFALGERQGLMALAMSSSQIALLLLSAIIGIALGHVFYYASIGRLGVAVSSGVIQLQPVLVSVASVFLFPNAALSPIQWAAGLLAIAGAGTILYMQHHLRVIAPAAPARTEAVTPTAAPDTAEFDTLPPDHVAAATAAHDRDG